MFGGYNPMLVIAMTNEGNFSRSLGITPNFEYLQQMKL
jgi:hypothetical protein